MESYLFSNIGESSTALIAEGWHKPGSLTKASGAWIHAAGTATFGTGDYPINSHEQWVWFAVEAGDVVLHWQDTDLPLKADDTCILPAGEHGAYLEIPDQARVLWVALEGQLAPMVVRKMGALLHMPLRQGALPSQMYLAKQIVQVMVRHSGTADATYQLQHLMYGMLASHWGQPVAMDAMLSHEIAKVVDALRASQYKENFSLADMAAISRMPMETFRKRFVSEVGMPPLSYVLHCKMERAKELLREGEHSCTDIATACGFYSVHHFSCAFKKYESMSPTEYAKSIKALLNEKP